MADSEGSAVLDQVTLAGPELGASATQDLEDLAVQSPAEMAVSEDLLLAVSEATLAVSER